MSGKYFATSKLVAAIRAGRLSGVVSALDDGADIEEADIHGFTGLPLRTACFEGDIAIVRELLRYGATPNALTADGPGAPLRLALRSGHPEIVALLIQHGAEIPPGIDLPAGMMELLDTLPPPCGETPVPHLPEDSDTEASINPAAVETHPYLDLTIEEVDVNTCYGTDTNLLNMDLLKTDVERDKPAAPAPAASGFWKTRRSKD